MNTLKKTGYFAPEYRGFIYLDSVKLIQNNNNIALIYHYSRNAIIKKILYDSDIDHKDSNIRFMYKLSIVDLSETLKDNKDKYWWLTIVEC